MPKTLWLEDFEFFERPFVETWLLKEAHVSGTEFGVGKIGCVAGDSRLPRKKAAGWIKANPSEAVLVLSDERLVHRYSIYRDTRVVLRNYFQPRWWGRQVFTLPLGFHPGFAHLVSEKPTEISRRYSWAFAGEVKGDRARMLETFSQVPESLVHLTPSFMHSDGLAARDLFDAYSASNFVLCPHGNKSPDSFRTTEALVTGAIPVTVLFRGLDYSRLVFGNHPFVVGQDWADAKVQVEELLSDPVVLEERRREVSEWFAEYTENLRSDLRLILEGRARRYLVSPQFTFQRQAIWNFRVQWIFASHYSRGLRSLIEAVKGIIDWPYLRTRRAIKWIVGTKLFRV